MQRRFFVALLPLLMIVVLTVPGSLSVQAMGAPAFVNGPLALTETAEPPTPTPITPTPTLPPTNTPLPTEPPTFTPIPNEGGDRKQNTPEPTETPVPPTPTVVNLSPTPEASLVPTATPVPTATAVPALPANLPRTGEPAGNGSMLFWLGIGVLAIALGGSLIRRRSA